MPFVLVGFFCTPIVLPSLSFVGESKYNGMVHFSTDPISVIMPVGGHSQGCHGYAPALLKAHILPSSTIP